MYKDLHNNINVVNVVPPGVAVTNDTPFVGTIVDSYGYGSLEYVILTGSLVDANATFTVLIEDGEVSTLTDNAAVADTFLLGTEAAASFTFAADNSQRRIGVLSKKRYSRITITPSGNTGDVYLAVAAIQGHAEVAAVANNA